MTDQSLEGRLANLARWDEAAPLHAQSALYDLDGFRAGRSDIRPFEHDEVGAVEGRELLHLQCHLGTDTLSWARHGARVSGLDFSPNAIEIAKTLAADCGIDAEFWCADVYDAVNAVGGRTSTSSIPGSAHWGGSPISGHGHRSWPSSSVPVACCTSWRSTRSSSGWSTTAAR